MNIFSFKKQNLPLLGFKQKLFAFFALILISISIFPVLYIDETRAQITPQGPSAGCNITVPNFTSSQLLSSKAVAGRDEKFSVYFEGIISESLASTCTEADKNNYEISVYVYDDDWGTILGSMVGAYNYQVSYPVSFFQENGKVGFRQKINDLSFGFLFSGVVTEGGIIYAGPGGTNRMYAFWHKKGDAPGPSWWNTNYVPSNGLALNFSNATPNPDTTSLPNIPGISAANTTVNNNTILDYTQIQTAIKPNANGKGLRTKYRVLWSDTAMNFGTTNGLDGVHAEWTGSGITPPQQFKLPKKDNGILWDFDPYFQGLNVFFNYFDSAKSTSTRACDSTTTGTSCSNVVFIEGNGSGSTGKTSLPNDFNPVLNPVAWQSKVSQPSSQQVSQGNNGQPLGSVDFVAIPILYGTKSSVANWVFPPRSLIVNDSVFLVSGGGSLQKFTLEVYANNSDITAACKADANVSNKADCDNTAFAKYGSGSTLTQTTSPTEAQSESATQSLYSFIIRVISSLVILLTTVIYKIFAFFVVPVINALLQVRPYQDAFVNIIYPGWLILRNLANIFFIIALLVVGLRIMFQQAASSVARGFIIRLILMALLVNFSLVVAQGVVGIADTVQSQFLPQNTRVIEALGTKLMVEPIVSFRTAVSGDGTTDITGELSGNQSIGDIAKPIVLLMLAVAAFFSFLAIGAFLAVRLVALMLLYMVSPLAYVGYVMDETRGWTKRWWGEFMKYAFLTPILVFFLNIAALVATTFSSTNGSVIKIEDTLAGDLVSGGLTIVSHFIVLIVIFAGMKYALSSGTFGAKAIVNYAQKGFKQSFKKPTEWAGIGKDMLVDKVASKLEKNDRPGFAKAITAASKPLDFLKEVKKTKLDEPKKDREGREAKRLASLAGAKEKGTPLKKYWDGIKEKDLGNEDSASLQDILTKNAKEHNGQKAGEAMLQMGKNGNFDEILESATKVTGKDKGYYSKDAAGLNAAVKDLTKSAGISEDETKEFMKSFDQAAKKDKNKSHYSGNIYRDKEGKVKIYDVEPDTERGGQKFKGEVDGQPIQNQWVQKQIDKRLESDGIVDDLKKTNLDSMVAKTVDNNGNEVYKFTDTQMGYFKQIDMAALTDNAIDRFKSSSPKKLQALREAWKSGGQKDLENQLVNSGVDMNLAADRVNRINKMFVVPGEKQETTASQSGSNESEKKKKKKNNIGILAQPVVVSGGGVINPSSGATSYITQSNQLASAQNVNNAIRFEKGPAGERIGDIDETNSQENQSSLKRGYAETITGKDKKTQQPSIDNPKNQIGFTAKQETKNRAGFTAPIKSKPAIVPAPDSKSGNKVQPGSQTTPLIETPAFIPPKTSENEKKSNSINDQNLNDV